MSENDTCPRWPEVEAAADGRFGPREVDRVERHLGQCASCRSRRARWEALRAEAREHARAPVTELEHRRARAALLRAAAAAGDEPRPSRARGFLFAGAFAVAASLVAAIALRGGGSRGGSKVQDAHAEARVDAVGDAQWARSHEVGRETVRLAEGVLRVTVPHQHPRHRFVVALPDGELEVRGTRFIVEARGGRTEQVTVFEGLVALRVGRSAEQLIAAGGRWHAPDPQVATVVPAPPVTSAPVPTPPAGATTAPPAHAVTRRAEPAGESPFQRFAAGVAAMGRGDFRVAAESFEDFERRQPHDERAEDAAWLRVVALRRGGDEPAALAAAERYLDRYPSGARRTDAASLVARSAYARGDCARVVALAQAGGASGDLARLRARCTQDGGT